MKNQTFGMIQDEVGEVFQEIPFEGILGLAFDELAVCDFPYVADCVPTPFSRMIAEGLIDEPVFSFFLGDLKPFGRYGYDGELTICGVTASETTPDKVVVRARRRT